MKCIGSTTVEFDACSLPTKLASKLNGSVNLIEYIPWLEGREQETDESMWRLAGKLLRI